jgi:molybdenum ABC transporter molybdate-binding protein
MRYSLLVVLALSLLVGCPKPASDRDATGQPGTAASPSQDTEKPLIVWADPLLKVPLVAINEVFSELYSPGLTPVYIERGDLLARFAGDGPSTLPDVFITADTATMAVLSQGGYANESTARTFAGDRLVLVQQPEKGHKTPTLFDTYRLRFDALGLGAEKTAVGRYAEQALVTDGCFNRLEERLQRFDGTSNALDALVADEVQLAIVTASQAAQQQGVEVILLIGEDLHEDIRYQAAASAESASNPAVQQLLMLLAEDDAVQELLTGYGLLDRELALQETK